MSRIPHFCLRRHQSFALENNYLGQRVNSSNELWPSPNSLKRGSFGVFELDFQTQAVKH